jgi:hypothetical protein
MTGKQIIELDAADDLEDGDLMLIRKTSMGVDRNLSRATLIESIGNSAVNGYVAKSTETNRITVTPSNNADVADYYDGMKVSFISPIKTDSMVRLKIGALKYTDLQKYDLDETVELKENEYVEAVYIDGVFKQTNNLNTALIWSHEYNASVEIAGDESTTLYRLTSAVGIKKPHYYKGMSLLFTVPATSKGVAFFNVDGLGAKHVGESGGSLIAKDIYKDQAIMAIYDGVKFIKQKFATTHNTPLVLEEIEEEEEEEKTEIQELIQEVKKEEERPVDIWAEDYAGDPDDPANTTSPNALDSKGKPIFTNTITVGKSGCMFKSVLQAITSLINDYGRDGGGNKFALEIANSNDYFDCGMGCTAHAPKADLRWISIFVKNNNTLNFRNTSIEFRYCKYTPILNFRMSFKRQDICKNYHTAPLVLCTPDTTLTFGKNTIINNYATCNTAVIQATGGGYFIEAKYGIKVRTNTTFTRTAILINKGVFEYNPPPSWENSLFELHGHSNNLKLYNTIIYTNIRNFRSTIKLFHIPKDTNAYLRNVTSTDRKGTARGLCNQGKANLENCDFSSKTEGSLNGGWDIVVDGKDSKITLINTKGNRNQAPGKKTSKGLIVVE